MGERIRTKDWNNTPVGAPDTWPQSLRTTLSIVLNSKFPMFLWWGSELICFYNDAYRPSLGKDGKHPSILGMRAEEAWPEIWHIIKPLIDQVLAGGEATWSEDQLIPIYRNGNIEDVYWTFSYSPVHDESGKPAGVFVTCTETTDKVNAFKSLAENEKRFRNIVKQAPMGITMLRGPEFIVEMANETYLQLVDKEESEFVGRPLFESLPEARQAVESLLNSVLRTGVPFYGIEFEVSLRRYGRTETSYFNFVYDALREDDGEISGIIVVAMEVTEIKQAKHQVAENERNFRSMIMQSPIGMTILRGEDFVVEMANQVVLNDIWQKKEEDVIGEKLLDLFPELKEQKYAGLLEQVFTTGQSYRESDAFAYVHREDGPQKLYLDFEYAPLLEQDGSISGILVTIIDVTEKVEARLRVEESERKLNVVIDASDLGTWELDLATGTVHYSPRYLQMLGYTDSVDLKHSEIIRHLHPDDLPVRQKAFEDAFKTGYLHQITRVIWNDGSLHWVEGKGRVFYDEKNTPIRLVGTLRDITDEKNFTWKLEQLVQERTSMLREANEKLELSILDLKKMNAELQSFAYVSSHDLQEPLRKIQTFAGRIQDRESENLSPTGKDFLQRMQDAARRMQTLIEDLLAYSRTNTTERIFKKTNLYDLIQEVKTDLTETLAEKQGTINIGEMPEMNLIPFQFSQLMHNLIGNALKFSKQDVPPVIDIQSEIVEGSEIQLPGIAASKKYCHLSVVDNGIGFSPEYKERIFEVFQRLHGRSEYKGTGIGLAIVKKIVENHYGVIVATGQDGVGAQFDMYIPMT